MAKLTPFPARRPEDWVHVSVPANAALTKAGFSIPRPQEPQDLYPASDDGSLVMFELLDMVPAGRRKQCIMDSYCNGLIDAQEASMLIAAYGLEAE